MKKMILSAAILAIGLNVQAAEPAQQAQAAQSSNQTLLEKIKARSSQNQQFVALLNDPDKGIRMATAQELIASGSPDLKNLALEAALNGDDLAMKQLAFESVLGNLTVITLQTIKEPAKLILTNVEGEDKKSESLLINEADFDKEVFSSIALQLGKDESGRMGCVNLKEGQCSISISGEQINISFTGKSQYEFTSSTTLSYVKNGRFEGIISAHGGYDSRYNYSKNGFVDIF